MSSTNKQSPPDRSIFGPLPAKQLPFGKSFFAATFLAAAPARLRAAR
jgi:hypothetical protein